MTAGDINYLGVLSGFNNISLGKISNWDDQKAAVMTPIPFPGANESNTEAIDTLGVIAYINISGVMTGSFATLQSAIWTIKNIADGKQTSYQYLYSPFVNAAIGIVAPHTRRRGHIGTNTSVTASKLVDSAATFSTNGVRAPHVYGAVTVYDYVKNLVTGEVALVTAVDSETQLSLSENIFTASGVNYAVTAHIAVKLLSINAKWEPPGINYVAYEMSVMQVKE